MSRLLSIREKLEILEIKRTRSASETARVFNQRHPERLLPLNRATVSKLSRKLDSTGTLYNNFVRGRTSILDNEVAVNNILNLFRENVHTSIRGAVEQTGHSSATVHTVLKKHKFFPYKQQKQYTSAC